jgi:hypothetical protein
MAEIRSRQIQPKQRYQVWWSPTKGSSPHWELAGAYEYPFQAYDERAALRKKDSIAEVIVTKTIGLSVIEDTMI